MKTTKLKSVIVAVVLAVSAFVGVSVAYSATDVGVPANELGAVRNDVLFSTASFTTTGTLYTASSINTNFNYYTKLYLGPNVSTSDTITITPQYSFDNVNWMDYSSILTFTVTGTKSVSLDVIGARIRLKVQKAVTTTATTIVANYRATNQ